VSERHRPARRLENAAKVHEVRRIDADVSGTGAVVWWLAHAGRDGTTPRGKGGCGWQGMSRLANSPSTAGAGDGRNVDAAFGGPTAGAGGDRECTPLAPEAVGLSGCWSQSLFVGALGGELGSARRHHPDRD